MKIRALNEFFKNNPYSHIEEVKNEDGSVTRYISEPWGDKTLRIRIPNKPQLLYKALNKVCLHERLSALVHLDKNDIEIMYTAFKLQPTLEDLKTRRFSFRMDDRDIECHFGSSSDRLIELAKHIQPTSNPSATLFRHMMSFNMYTNRGHYEELEGRFGSPLSFYLKSVGGLDDEKLISLIRHINFHMKYHDAHTPLIHIHDPEPHDEEETLPIRYIEGQFPVFIQCRKIDETILSFWEGAMRSDSLLKFIIFYRIIEYVAMQHADQKTRAKISVVLQRPSLLSNIGSSIGEIAAIARDIAERSQHDVPRTTSMCEEFVDCKKLWLGVERFRDELSQDVTLDGGFVIPRLIAKEDSYANFEPKGVANFYQQARRIRNALSHGKDIGSEGVISPTKRNLHLLEPWVELMRIVAGEVVVYHTRH